MRQLNTEVKIMKQDREHTLDWDDPMPSYMYLKWRTLFKEFFDLEFLEFPRCVKPKGTVGKPMLIVFSDANLNAYFLMQISMLMVLVLTLGGNLIVVNSQVSS